VDIARIKTHAKHFLAGWDDKEASRLKLLVEAITTVRDEKKLSQDELFEEVEPFADALGCPLGGKQRPADIGKRVSEHFSNWKDAKGYKSHIASYLAWLAWRDNAEAVKLYNEVGLADTPAWHGEPPKKILHELEVTDAHSNTRFGRIDLGQMREFVSNLVEKTLSQSGLLRLMLGGFAVLATLVLSGVSLTIGSQRHADSATLDAINTTVVPREIDELTPLSPPAQIEVLESALERRQLSPVAQAEFISYLALLHSFEGASSGLTLADTAASLAPTNANLLLRSIVLSFANHDDAGVSQGFERIQNLNDESRPPWVAQALQHRWLFSPEGWVAQDWSEELAISTWSFIGSLDDSYSRNLLMVYFSALEIQFFQEVWLSSRYLEYTANCNAENLMDIGPTWHRLCQSIFAQYQYHNGFHLEAIDLIEEASRLALVDRAFAQHVSLKVQKAHLVRRYFPNGSDRAVEELRPVLPIAQQVENPSIKFLFFHSLFALYRDWPKSEIEGSLPYAREAFAAANGELSNPLFRYNNFLSLYASAEDDFGDADLALRIRSYLNSLPPEDFFPDPLAHATAASSYARQLALAGRTDEAERVWRNDVIAPYERAIDTLPELEPLDIGTPPGQRPAETAFRALQEQLALSSASFLINDLYQLRLDSYHLAPEEVQTHYRRYYLWLRMHQLGSSYDWFRGIYLNNSLGEPDRAHLVEQSSALERDILHFEGRGELLADYIDMRLLRGWHLLPDEEVSRLVTEGWAIRVSEYFSETATSRDEVFRRAIEFSEEWEPFPGRQDPYDVYQEIDSVYPNPWPYDGIYHTEFMLLRFIVRNHRRLIDALTPEDLRLSAYMLLRRDRSKLQPNQVRDDYVALARIYRSFRVNSELSNDTEVRIGIGDSKVALNYAELWLEAYEPSWTNPLEVYSSMALISSIEWYNFFNPERARSRLDEFERVDSNRRVQCLDCEAFREDIRRLEIRMLELGVEPPN
jgi:hypothetical protein